MHAATDLTIDVDQGIPMRFLVPTFLGAFRSWLFARVDVFRDYYDGLARVRTLRGRR